MHGRGSYESDGYGWQDRSEISQTKESGREGDSGYIQSYGVHSGEAGSEAEGEHAEGRKGGMKRVGDRWVWQP